MKLQFLTNFGIGPEKEYFIEQFAMLFAAGMPVLLALSSIEKEIKSAGLKKIMAAMEKEIESGSTIASALEKSGLFSQATVSLIRIGEESGRLSENLKVVALQQEKERELRSKITSAMMYPGFVFTLTVTVGLAVAWFILPRLAGIFASLHAKLPLITVWLIKLGSFLEKYGIYAIPAFIMAILLLLFFLFIFKKTNFLGQAVLLRLPALAGLLKEIELTRFGSLLGNLLQAGLPVLDSLTSLGESTELYCYQKLYLHLYEKVKEGNSFQKSFQSFKGINRLLPVSIQQLVITGEQSGHLVETLIKIGQNYETKTEITAKNISVLLEPMLLVIVWLGVVAVAVAVILPLYSLLGSINPSGPPKATVVKRIEEPVKTASQSAVLKLKISKTSTGFLNIREEPLLTAKIKGKASPGEIYAYQNKKNNWYEIILEATSSGWVNGDYVEEIK